MSSFPIDLDPLAIPDPRPQEPTEIRAGDTLQWNRSSEDYAPADGYSLSYAFVSRTNLYTVGGGMVTGAGNDYAITVPAATTAAWEPDRYRWQAYASDTNGNRWTIAEGVARVLPNLQVQTGGFDDREDDEIMLDCVVALLRNKVLTDAQEYRIQERELRKYTFAELLDLRKQLESRVRGIRIDRGEIPATQTIGVSFDYGY